MQKPDDKKAVAAITDYLTRAATDQGKIVEFGWKTLCDMAWKDATDEQKKQLRMAFFAGA